MRASEEQGPPFEPPRGPRIVSGPPGSGAVDETSRAEDGTQLPPPQVDPQQMESTEPWNGGRRRIPSLPPHAIPAPRDRAWADDDEDGTRLPS